ncbi:MAG: amino acid adenylation domain-containing protein [Phycisphaerales bacterium]|jgi:amino acid adenylation domain-containing protein
MSRGQTILDAIDGAFAAHGDRVAIESWPDGECLTYRQLQARSASLAAALARSGVAPGSMVPIVLPRCADYLVAVVAILRCGAAYAPIDPAAPRREAMLSPLRSPVVVGRETGMLDPASITEPGEAPVVECSPEHPAYVMYTSGTTGRPKGVLVPHRAVTRLVIDADYAEFGPDKRWGVMSAVAFDASTLEIWGALLHGGCCIVQTMAVPGLDDLADYLTKGRVTDTWLTASLFNAMVDEHPRAMSHMHQLLTGGERESMPHVRRFKQQNPGVRLIHGYGPTENTTFSLCHTITDEDARGGRIPIGTPINGSTVRIVRPGGTPDEQAHEGELLVGGAGLALGYLNDEARTAEKFVEDRDGTRWYRTGDLVQFREDGAAVFVGRVDRQVKIRGHRVEPDGIEHELAACPGVEQAAVAVTGETAETRRMTAFFVPAGDTTAASVRAELAERLPPTQMPERFVAVESMPIGPTGKADRGALVASLETDERRASVEANDLESALIRLFSNHLGADIRPDQPFREAGGHSLLAMRLSADVRRELGVALPAAQILRLQTIGSIARLVPSLPAAEAVGPTQHADPIGDIRRRASLEHARDGTALAMLVHHAWHVSAGFELEDLRRAWLALLERHDALRTSVAFTDAGPTLVEHDPRTADVFHAEHDRLAAPDPGDPRVRRAIERTIGPGDPPARLHAWPLADGSHFVLLVFHHAAIDEWSLQVLSDELDALLKGESLEPATPYQAFVDAEYAMMDVASAERLADRIAGGEAPTAEPPPPGPQAGRNYEIELELLTESTLDARAASLGVSPPALVAAALGTTLRSRYGPPGRWLMTPFARRPGDALQRVVGCCLDMRPLEASGASFEETARALHQQMLDAQDDRTLPLETLVERIRGTTPERAGDATRFGLTYRYIDDRPTPLGNATATPIDVPQPAARFGLCLHVERRPSGLRLWLEASRAQYTDDQLGAIGRQIVDLVLAGTASRPDAPGAVATELEADDGVSAHALHVLSELWAELLGTRPRPDGDFFQDGGTSLLAMRLAAAIHKRLGRRLMLNQFLRRPTLEGLARSIRDDAEHPYAEFSIASHDEDRTDSPWCVAVPGSAGRAIDLYRLWHELGRDDAAPMDMLAYDLATIATGESNAFEPDRFFARFTALTHAYAMSRNRRGPLTLMGYSLGGLVALDMAARLQELGHDVQRVVLLDAYAPPYLSRTLPWYLAKINAKLRTAGRKADVRQPAPPDHESGDAHAAEVSRATWRGIHQTLARWQPPTVTTPTVLLRSRPAWKHVRPVWHARTNGLGSLLAGPVDVRVLGVAHLAMLTTGSDAVADSLRDLLCVPTPATPPKRESRPSPSEHHPARP